MESVEEEQSVRAVIWVHDSVEKCLCIYTMVALSASHPEAELVSTGTSVSACKESIACVPCSSSGVANGPADLAVNKGKHSNELGSAPRRGWGVA